MVILQKSHIFTLTCLDPVLFEVVWCLYSIERFSGLDVSPFKVVTVDLHIWLQLIIV